MNAHRLLTLAALLDNVDDDRFYLGFWATHADLNVCGSRGCAVGWATTIPEFRVAGLCLIQCELLRINTPLFQEHTGFDAVMHFFDIDCSTALRLFGTVFYKENLSSARAVASNIRRFLASDLSAAAFIAEVEQQAECNERAAIQTESA